MGRQRLVYRVEPARFPEDFPERLEAFRQAAGLSRRELARRLHADVRLLKRWNTGTRPDSAYPDSPCSSWPPAWACCTCYCRR